MLAALIVLAVLLVGALGLLAWLLLRTPEWLGTRWPRADPAAAQALNRTPGPPVVAGTTRRLITIEILNSGELAGSRGRLAGLAHAVVPGLARRVVYDEALKIVRDQLRAQHVEADVRVHTIRPADAVPAVRPARKVDTVTTIDLTDPNDPPA